MGFSSYKITDFRTKQISADLLEISYRYSIIIETEFTYYPDNRPMEYPHKKVIESTGRR